MKRLIAGIALSLSMAIAPAAIADDHVTIETPSLVTSTMAASPELASAQPLITGIPSVGPHVMLASAQPSFDADPDGVDDPADDDTATPPGTDEAGGIISGAYDALKNGVWLVFIANCLLLIAMIGGERQLLGKLWPWFKTDRGGAALALATAFLAHLGHTLLASEAVNAEMFFTATALAIGAIGGYAGFRKLFFPSDQAEV